MWKFQKVRQSKFKYNKKRYIELLEEQAKAKGIYWYNDNKDWKKWLELSDCTTVLSYYLVWVEREKFLNNTIEFEQFAKEFSKLWLDTLRKVDKEKLDVEVIKTIDPDPRLDSFCFRMTAIYRGFEAVEDEASTEEELRLFVKRLLIKIKRSNFNSEKNDVDSNENES